MSTELGVGYVSILPSAKGFGRGLAKQIGPDLAKAGKDGGAAAGKGFSTGFTGQVVGVGKRVASTLTKTIVGGAAVAGATFTAIMGKALVGGFSRLSALEDAASSLDNMGLSAGQVEGLMGSLNKTLQGTPFALDAGASALARFVSSGMNLDEIPGVLQSVTDAAAFGKADLNEVASIFNRIGTNGKLSALELEMLSDRGIPALALLADAAGVTQVEFKDMISNNEVSSEDFFSLWEEGAKGFGDANIRMAGAAQSAGGTTRGAWSNAMTALNRFGAGLLGPAFVRFPLILSAITAAIGNIGAAVTPVIGPLVGRLGGGLAALSLRFADFTSKLDSADVLLFIARIIDLKDTVVGFFSGAASGVDPSILGFDRLKSIFETLKTTAIEVWPAIQQIAASLGAATARVGISTWQALLAILDPLVRLLSTILVPTLDTLADVMAKHPALVTAVVAAYSTWKLAKIGSEAVTMGRNIAGAITGVVGKARAGASAVSGFFSAGGGADGIRLRAMAAGDAIKAAGTKIKAGAAAVRTWAAAQATAARSTLASTAATVKQGVALAAAKVKTLALAAASKVMAVAQAALNLVMSLNPITLIVIAIAALIGGLVLAYTKVGWFRDFIDAAFRFIKTAVTTYINAVRTVITTVFNAVKTYFTTVLGIYRRIFTSVFNAIKTGVTTYVNAVRTVITTVFNAVKAYITTVVGIYRRVIDTAWRAIRTLVTNYINGVRTVVTTVLDTIKGIWRRGWDSLKALVSAPLDAIKGIVLRGVDAVLGFFRDLPGKLRSAMSGVADAIKSPFTSAFNAIKSLWNSTVGGFGFTIPSWVPNVGGNSFNIPNMHTGGVVPGGRSDEVLRLLQGGEVVLSRANVATLAASTVDDGTVALHVDRIQIVAPNGKVLAEQLDTRVLAKRLRSDRMVAA